jgi:hypothetical protein
LISSARASATLATAAVRRLKPKSKIRSQKSEISQSLVTSAATQQCNALSHDSGLHHARVCAEIYPRQSV